MNQPRMNHSRRHWLKAAGLVGASAGLGTLGNLLLPAAPARAADYKALVCIFLYGGNDGLNTIVPTDATRYGQYAAVRKAPWWRRLLAWLGVAR